MERTHVLERVGRIRLQIGAVRILGRPVEIVVFLHELLKLPRVRKYTANGARGVIYGETCNTAWFNKDIPQ